MEVNTSKNDFEKNSAEQFARQLETTISVASDSNLMSNQYKMSYNITECQKLFFVPEVDWSLIPILKEKNRFYPFIANKTIERSTIQVVGEQAVKMSPKIKPKIITKKIKTKRNVSDSFKNSEEAILEQNLDKESSKISNTSLKETQEVNKELVFNENQVVNLSNSLKPVIFKKTIKSSKSKVLIEEKETEKDSESSLALNNHESKALTTVNNSDNNQFKLESDKQLEVEPKITDNMRLQGKSIQLLVIDPICFEKTIKTVLIPITASNKVDNSDITKTSDSWIDTNKNQQNSERKLDSIIDKTETIYENESRIMSETTVRIESIKTETESNENSTLCLKVIQPTFFEKTIKTSISEKTKEMKLVKEVEEENHEVIHNDGNQVCFENNTICLKTVQSNFFEKTTKTSKSEKTNEIKQKKEVENHEVIQNDGSQVFFENKLHFISLESNTDQQKDNTPEETERITYTKSAFCIEVTNIETEKKYQFFGTS